MILAYSIADQSFERSTSLGILRISLALLGELARRPELGRIIAYRNPAFELDPEILNLPAVSARDVRIRGNAQRIAWEQWGAIAAARRDNADWLFLPKGFSSFIPKPALKTAAYVHDIMAATYFDRYPRQGGRIKQAYFARALAATLKNASAVLTNTEFTKSEILGWARRKGLVVRSPIDVAGYGIPEPRAVPDRRQEIIVCDIRDSPHKRPDIAVAFLLKWSRDSGFGGRIVFVGRPPDILPTPLPPSWEFTGKIPPAQYGELMRSALAHIHFTEYEGFGLPPVESIMLGTPAVFSDIEAASEVMAGTGCPFQNSSYASFAEAMERALATDPATITRWQQALHRRHNWRSVGDRVIAALKNK